MAIVEFGRTLTLMISFKFEFKSISDSFNSAGRMTLVKLPAVTGLIYDCLNSGGCVEYMILYAHMNVSSTTRISDDFLSSLVFLCRWADYYLFIIEPRKHEAALFCK